MAASGPAGNVMPSTRRRIAVAVGIAAVAVAYTVVRGLQSPRLLTDLDHLLFAARAMIAGSNPYLVVGPGKAFEWPYPLYYPAPALLVVLPLVYLPVLVSRATFAALSCGALAYAVTREGWFRLPLFLSAALLLALGRLQWSPLLLAALFIPWLGVFTVSKPNIGLTVFAGQRSWRGVLIAAVAAAALTLVSFAVHPAWPVEWLAAVRGKHDAYAPVMQLVVGGPLLLLALVRWRDPRARVLATLAVVPHSPFVYDTLPVMFVARSAREALVLALAADVAFIAQLATASGTAGQGPTAMMARMLVVCVYLPALVLVMRKSVWGNREPSGLDRALGAVAASVFALLLFAIFAQKS
jgi:hypothetical protein